MPDATYFKPTDAAAIMTSLVKQLSAQTSITKVDSTNFVDAGKSVLETGYEGVFNALSVLVTRTITASRPTEDEEFALISKSEDSFSDRVRKISIYSKMPQETGFYNTDENTNLGAGLDDESGVGSQWEQAPYMVVEKFFGPKEFAWQHEYTEYIEQINIAFTSEAELAAFLNGMRTELINDMKAQRIAKNRLAVLSRIAGNKLLVDKGDLNGLCAVNLTKEFNKEYGTAYTTAQLLHEHRIAFYKFFLAKFKIYSKLMKNRTALFHDPLTKTVSDVNYYVLRHTPLSMQRFIYNDQLFTEVEFDLSEIFHPDRLAFPRNNAEGIMYWQSPEAPFAIDIVPALPDGAKGSEVVMDVCLGILYDNDALASNNRYTGALSTPVNARHGYRNTFYNFKYSLFSDYSENSIVFYMSDSNTEYFTGDGTEDDFVLEGTATTIVSVTVDGVAQTSGTDYTFAGNTITFAAGHIPADGKIIQVIYK